MSDDQRPARPAEHDEPQDEVEGHGTRPARPAANDEPKQEGDDEVEAHRHIRTAEPDSKFA
jgi:hypothetical protein